MKLTNREKVLIWLFINLTLFIGGVSKVVPRALEQYSQAKIEEEIYVNKQIEVEGLLAQKPYFDDLITEQYVSSSVLTEPYFNNITPEYLDVWLQELPKKEDVKLRTLTMGEVKISSISTYQPSKKILDYSVKNYYDKIQSNKGVNTETSVIPVKGSAEETILERSLVINLTGSRKSLATFLDTLTNTKQHIKVNAFTLNDTELKVEFTVYMVEYLKEGEF